MPAEEPCKVGILTLKNTAPIKKKLELIYYIKPVLGEDEIKSNNYINVEYEKNNNIITAKNLYNMEFQNEIAYISSSEPIKSFTGDKKFFIGNGDLSNPEGAKKVTSNNDSGSWRSGNQIGATVPRSSHLLQQPNHKQLGKGQSFANAQR